jgi:hypothetical protein
VRTVLRGINPEGRAWAAWALLAEAKRGTPLVEEDRAALAKLESLPLELFTCSGCVFATQRWSKALAALDG